MIAVTRRNVFPHLYTIRDSLDEGLIMRKCTQCKNQGPDFLIDGLFLILEGAGEASLGLYISTDKSDMDTNESLGDSIITGESIPRHKWSVLLLCTECATSKSTVLASDVYF